MSEAAQSGERKRGGCLTAYLIAMFVLNPLVSIFYLFAGSSMMDYYPGVPAWAIPVWILFGLINVGLAIGLWNWKRWGVYGFGVMAVVSCVVNLLIGVGIFSALSGFIALALIIFLVRPIWEHMD